MKKSHREALIRIMNACHDMGTTLDGTATVKRKYIDRQRAHTHVYKAIYSILCDHPDNEYKEQDLETLQKSIEALEAIAQKRYPDIHGNYDKPQER